jgi:hypothetical protein
VPDETPRSKLDIDGVIEVFARHRVDCLLIGGVADRHHGAKRETKDIDFVARHEVDKQPGRTRLNQRDPAGPLADGYPTFRLNLKSSR